MVTVTVGSTLLVIILWSALYIDTLSYNVAYSETITGIFDSDENTNLGVSYW
jgi:hypothetical protein